MSETSQRLEIIDWAEKYQPQSIDELILPKILKARISEWKTSEKFPHLLLYGAPGTGKTSTARFLAGEKVLWIRCNVKRHLYMISKDAHQLYSIPLFTERRVVVVDDIDLLDSGHQATLRGLLEDLSNVNLFILTCNDVRRLERPLQSRCYPIEFDYGLTGEIQSLLLGRLREIIELERRDPINDEVLHRIIRRSFPDIRSMIKHLQAET